MTIAPLARSAFPEVVVRPYARDPEEVLSAARESFQNARPFRHAVIDGLFAEELLDRVLEEVSLARTRPVERDQKSYRKHIGENWTRQGPYTNHLIDLVTSPRFLSCVEQMTGVHGLIGDSHLRAGGLHETHRGGFLELHTDFNHNGRLKLFRRLNFLLYLNRDWKEEYKGHLELWDGELRESARVLPVFNRLVICDVLPDSIHGFPEPLECPEGMTRKSLALWYYTVDQPANVQAGWDVCEPAFVERRDGKPVPLPRPLWRKLLPPVLVHLLKKEQQARSFSPEEFRRVATRFLPPAAVQAWYRLRGVRNH